MRDICIFLYLLYSNDPFSWWCVTFVFVIFERPILLVMRGICMCNICICNIWICNIRICNICICNIWTTYLAGDAWHCNLIIEKVATSVVVSMSNFMYNLNFYSWQHRKKPNKELIFKALCHSQMQSKLKSQITVCSPAMSTNLFLFCWHSKLWVMAYSKLF